MHLRDTLLLVNDTPRARAGLQRIFESNYNLLEAENGAQALTLLEHNHRHIAAVLLDTHMPVMDGFQVLSAMASNGLLSQLPVLVVAEAVDSQTELRCFEAGASEVISLTVSDDVLRRRVQNIIALCRRRWQLEQALGQTPDCSAQPAPARDSAHLLCQPLAPNPCATPTEATLRRDLERLQTIMEQSDDIVFEWDMAEDSLIFSHKWHRLFGYEPIFQNISSSLFMASHIHPQDLPLLHTRMNSLLEGNSYEDTEIRIANADGRYLWCRLRASLMRGEDGRPLRAVGIIINIDAEKRTARALQDRAERDSLTKLLNKNTSRAQVEHRLQHRGEQECCALIMMDLDDFKQVNDNHGHLFGDTVLTQTAAQLRRFFRSEDVIARVGGDEFMIFVSNLPDRGLIQRRCDSLISAFSTLFREQLGQRGLSCSMGAALCPQHGTSFQALFQKADLALYHAKTLGKNRFAFYDMESDASFGQSGTDRPHSPTLAQSAQLNADALPKTFHLLSQAGDVMQTICSILEMAARQMQVSRVCLYETSPQGECYNNTFQWCAPGVLPVSGELHHFIQTDHPMDQRFDERGVFSCPDVAVLPREEFNLLAAQGVRSLLQFAVVDRGMLRGFFGFEQHTAPRIWSQEQIDSLYTLCQILSVFLLKHRAQNALEQLESFECNI